MRQIRYAVAMSVDGYIAGPNGEYDWIDLGLGAAAEYFRRFYAQFIAVLGRKSYEQFPGAVEGLETYVLSRSLPSGTRSGVTFLGADALERVRQLRELPGKDIWLWGGGEIFGSLASADLVDTVEISLVPVFIGAGRKVIAGCDRHLKLRHRETHNELPGYVGLVYDVIPAGRG